MSVEYDQREADAIATAEASGWKLVHDNGPQGHWTGRVIRFERGGAGGTQSAVGHDVSQAVFACLRAPGPKPTVNVSSVEHRAGNKDHAHPDDRVKGKTT